MTMLTDEEQMELLETDGPTTQKINKRLSEYEQKRLKGRTKEEAEQEERILKQIAPVVEAVNDLVEFKNGFAKTFSHVGSFLKKATGSK